MASIFLVIRKYDIWQEEIWSKKVLIARGSKEAAQESITAFKQADLDFGKRHEVFKAECFQWDKDNAMPSDGQVLKEVPKWRAGIRMDEITPAMRQEREGIKAYNAAIREEWDRQQRKHTDVRDSAHLQIAKKYGIKESEIDSTLAEVLHYHPERIDYYVQEVPFEE